MIMGVSVNNCGSKQQEKKWATGDTMKANDIQLDVRAVEKAFQEAKDVKDFEERVNKIYTGEELIGVVVEDKGRTQQVVTLYVDRNNNHSYDTGEEILRLTRGPIENNNVTYVTTGYGPYAYYSRPSPVSYALAGAAVGAFIALAVFRPYSTPVARYTTIRQTRTAYRSTPAYRSQVQRSRTLSRSFSKNAPSHLKSSARSWNSKGMQKGSFMKGDRKASSPSKSTSSSSSEKRSFGSSNRTSSPTRSGGTRSFGGRKRR